MSYRLPQIVSLLEAASRLLHKGGDAIDALDIQRELNVERPYLGPGRPQVSVREILGLAEDLEEEVLAMPLTGLSPRLIEEAHTELGKLAEFSVAREMGLR